MPGSLVAQTTYYWRVDESNAQGITTGTVWRFTTAAATGPTLKVDKGTYAPGAPIVATFANASGSAKGWIGLYSAGAANSNYLIWSYVDGTQTGITGVVNGSVTFPGALSAVGSYEARLFSANGYLLLATATFTVQNGPLSTIVTNTGVYAPNQPIAATFTNASGSPNDWIGLYVAGAANTAYLQWLYVDGAQTAAAGVLNGSVSFPTGLPAGTYEVRLFLNNTYTMEASAAFSVQGP